MKAAKLRFKFGDGTSTDVDLGLAFGLAQSQLARYLRLQHQAQIDASKRGGDRLKAASNADHQALDDAIQGCFARGETTRRYVKTWALEYEVSDDTVRRRIKLLKPK